MASFSEEILADTEVAFNILDQLTDAIRDIDEDYNDPRDVGTPLAEAIVNAAESLYNLRLLVGAPNLLEASLKSYRKNNPTT